MTSEFITQISDSGKASYETFQKFNVINVEVLQKLAELQFSLASLNVESSVQQARLLTNSRDPQKFFEAESALASAYGEKLMQITSETTELLTNSREQLVAFAENTLEPVKQAAMAAKPTRKPTAKKATAKKTTKKVRRKAA